MEEPAAVLPGDALKSRAVAGPAVTLVLALPVMAGAVVSVAVTVWAPRVRNSMGRLLATPAVKLAVGGSTACASELVNDAEPLYPMEFWPSASTAVTVNVTG